jgi:hypothetical protein
MQLWGTASTSNVEILECFQLKALHMKKKALLYMPNTVIQRDLETQQLNKKFGATALNTLPASVHSQMTQGTTSK